MVFEVLTKAQEQALASQRWGALTSEEGMAELLRAEVTRRNRTPRASVIRRVQMSLQTLRVDCDGEKLREICGALERQGDLTASSGGILHTSPLRLVELAQRRFMVLASAPSAQLRASLPGSLSGVGIKRICHLGEREQEAFAAAVEALGGMTITPEVWAGFGLTPLADDQWLAHLEKRLTWTRGRVGNNGLEWSGLEVSSNGVHWRRGGTELTRLWRAKDIFRRYVWAWSNAGQVPSENDALALTSDEASRTLFALGRKEQSLSLQVERGKKRSTLVIDAWLPRAEYRYLSALSGQQIRRGAAFCWDIPNDQLAGILDTLEKRLGMQSDESKGATI